MHRFMKLSKKEGLLDGHARQDMLLLKQLN